jgi:predicted DNA binding CopG/RHH family protein
MTKREKPEKLRISATVVMDADSLEKARAKAAEHGMPFPVYLEQAVRLYGKYLDKKISVLARPI